jgi:hypothetical protein
VAITIGRGVAKQIRDSPTGILLQVHGASHPEAATSALEQARLEIAALDGGWQSAPGLNPGDTNGPTYLSPVTVTPAGPLLYIDGGYTPRELLATIPEIIVRQLEVAGVRSARIVKPDTRWPFANLYSVANGVVLRLYPPPPTGPASRTGRARIPPEWLDEMAAWVMATAGDEVWIDATVPFAVARDDAPGLLRQLRKAGAISLVAGDRQHRLRGAQAWFVGQQPVVLAGGGPDATRDELVETMGSLVELARRLESSVAYAFVTIEPSLLMLYNVHVGTSWSGIHKGAAPELVSLICDEIVLDGFAYQLLGPHHVALLSTSGIDISKEKRVRAEEVGGKLEVVVGEPDDWLIERLPALGGGDWTIDLGPLRRDPDILD